MNRLFTTLALLLLSVAAFAQSPNDVIQSAADELAAGLDGRKEELSGNKTALYALIDEILLPRFDRRYAAQLVLGSHWRTANAEQRDSFINAFYGTLLRKYADGVLEYNQDRVEILPFRGDDSKARITVKSIVQLDDGTKVPVNYGLVRRDTGWLMFDVTIEGISYVRNFRTELNAEIRAKDLDAVIARLESEMAAD
ncbi:MAG: MlaC/ttg2D family ABC transporter substrate-binding protein [Woeseiaceae bacterium]